VPRQRLGVIMPLPEPVAMHVQAWRRALGDPAAAEVPPHLTLVPPQTAAADQREAAIALVERAAAAAAPGVVELRGAATFLPESPVAFLVVTEGATMLKGLEAALREPPLHRRTFPFHPHVTVTQDHPPEVLQAAARDLRGFHASWVPHEVVLMEESGDVWRPLHRARIGAAKGEEEVREVPFSEAASAALFLLDLGSGQVLLGHRTHRMGHRYPGVWDALGGKPEPGESLLAALLREVGEEAGVEPLDAAPLGCFHDGDRADAFYLTTAWQGEPRNTDPVEHSELRWLPLEKALQEPLAPGTRQALLRLLWVLRSTDTG
jgi:8-oxo-dGTP pyrophosphatase MutT (NUDIX family)/2'-5' RNA ligase